MVDPQVRLQNIALETQELLAERSMAWSEATNRAALFMTVLGAAVLALVLIGNATGFDQSFLLVALLVLPVVLVLGLSTIGRLGELDNQDMRWIQGLNRLRHARLELDPTFEQFLVTSKYDDVDAILGAYSAESANPVLHNLFVLPSLIGIVSALIAAVIAADVALIAGGPTALVAIVSAIAFVGVVVGMSVYGYRSFLSSTKRVKSRFPTPSKSAGGD